jgi:hypothetical protein
MAEFEITKLEMQKSEHGKAFHFLVEWTCRPTDLVYFGNLNKYYRASAIDIPIQELEAFEESLPEMDFDRDFDEQENGDFLWNPKYENAYDKGFVQFKDIKGIDVICAVDNKENTYSYRDWVVDCPVTRAIAAQVMAMDKQLRNGKDASYRSGSTIHDFAILIQSLNLFWD